MAVALVLGVAACEEPAGGNGPVFGTPVVDNPLYGPPPPALTAEELAELEASVSLALGDSTVQDSPGQFWSLVIDGYTDPAHPAVRYTAGEVPSTACGADDPDPRVWANNAVYCPTDQTIAYDWNHIQLLYGRIGSAAPIALLSHEWGHHVQRLVGFPEKSKATELQADCFAGLYLGWLHGERGRLTDEQLVGVANNFFYIGDDALGAFFANWYDAQVHGNANQRRMAYLVGFDGADYGNCESYAEWSEAPPWTLNDNQSLILAPGLSAQTEQFGNFTVTRITGAGAEARVIANLDFQTTDPTAAVPAALDVTGLAQQPGLQQGQVTAGWLSASGSATGSAVALPYTLPATQGTIHGFLVVHIAADGTGMVWDIGSMTSGAELSLLNVLNAGYCERGARLFGTCPMPDP